MEGFFYLQVMEQENEIAGGLDSGQIRVYAKWFIFFNIEDILDVG